MEELGAMGYELPSSPDTQHRFLANNEDNTLEMKTLKLKPSVLY